MAMQKKEKFLEKQKEQQAEDRSDLGRHQSPWVCSCYQVGGQDDASSERPMTNLRRPELSCFCFHEGGHDPMAPPESQGSDENHLHQPCGKMGGLETLDEKRRRCGGGGI
jgi:hypothetical protein